MIKIIKVNFYQFFNGVDNLKLFCGQCIYTVRPNLLLLLFIKKTIIILISSELTYSFLQHILYKKGMMRGRASRMRKRRPKFTPDTIR